MCPKLLTIMDAAVLALTGALQAQREVSLALAVDLCVEHLVLEVGGGPRLELDVRARGLDDLIVLVRSRRGRNLQRSRVLGFRVGYDPQARALGRLRGR